MPARWGREGPPTRRPELRVQRPRPDPCAHDPGRSFGALRAPRRSGPRSDLGVEVRRPGGVLTPDDPPEVTLPPGDGPRHFAFHPDGRRVLLHPGGRLHHRRLRLGRRERAPDAAADHLEPAARVCRQQLLSRSWCRPTAGSFTAATGCTTALASSRWAAPAS